MTDTASDRAGMPLRDAAFAPGCSWRWSERDEHRIAFLVVALAASVGIVFRLLPHRLDVVHTYMHGLGLMAPTCGLTRAGLEFLGGDLTAAWTYNPAVFLVAPFAAALIVRFAGGVVSGCWLTLQVRIGVAFRVVVATLLIALWINQQAHFALLAA